jgi:hypothetical protein
VNGKQTLEMGKILSRVSVIRDRIFKEFFSLARFTIAQTLTHRGEDLIEIFGRYISFATRTRTADGS